MKEENEAIIKALNMYGRVPKTYELINEIERLNNIINKIIEMFDADEHFEDGCYCYEIEKYLKELKGEYKEGSE